MNDYTQDDECRHGMPAPEQCALCMDEARRRSRFLVMTGSRPDRQGVTAEYHGRCGTCGDTITPGDQITGTDDGYVHAGCY